MTCQEINSNLSLKSLPNEIFKDIPDYEGIYQISNLGRIKILKRFIYRFYILETIKKIRKNENGYFVTMLSKNKKTKNFKIHRLVLLTFKGYSKLPCNHIDGNKSNNNLNNLEYCTKTENERHARKIGLKNDEYKKVKIICNETKEIFNSIKEAEIKLKTGNISAVLSGKYKQINGYTFKKL